MATGWKRLSSELAYKNPRFKVFMDRVIFPDGSRGVYYHRKSKPVVLVLPFDGKKLWLVNQYRYPIAWRSWEIPMGTAENTNYLQQAKKELQEETGFRAKNWKFIGEIYQSPGSSNTVGKLFLAKGLLAGQPNREPGESDMYAEGFTIRQINEMVKQGKIIDSWTLAALQLFQLKAKIV